MNVRTKAVVVAYLTIWTTTVAYLAVVTIRPLYPDLVRVWIGALGLLPTLTPFIAFFLAFGQAMSVTRKRNAIDKWMLARYFLGAPICIFLTLLTIISLLTFTLAPVTFYLGLVYGAVPLMAGTAIHLVGMVPLYYLDRWLHPPAQSRISAAIASEVG
ncbi:hypothetical protein [Bradyrhizobium algeriense]|uniref:hypothetical protein n=1 Tax=Bradyrhizobium algeriense TaxID=634784 RepID=UPI000D35059D|nr:hypothetical protein [Bradyrhizobium algeriense]